MSFLKALLPVLVVGILVALPVEAHAQSARFFGPIISDECRCDAEHNNGIESAPEWGCVLDTVQAGFNLLFSLSMVFFVLMATYAGVLLMTSGPDASKRSKARAMLLNIVLGLLIALSAWLVVDFVMRALYDENRGWGPWNRILAVGAPRCLQPREPQDIGIEIGGGQVAGRFRVGDEVVCTFAGADHEATVTEIEQTNDDGSQLMTIRYDQSGATRNNTQSSACRSRSATEPGEEEPGEETPVGNEAQVREELRLAGITINNANACPDGVTYQQYNRDTGQRCTSVGGLLQTTIDQAKNLRGACGPFQISGGSELGHSSSSRSHASGVKFDIATPAQSSFSACIRSKTTGRTPTFGSEQRVDRCGNVYTLETNPVHWDVDVRSSCSL